MLFLPYIFLCILAFGDAQYKDGTYANQSTDFVSQAVDKTKEVTASFTSTKSNVSAADELKKYKELLDLGVLTQEEFEAKKKELLE